MTRKILLSIARKIHQHYGATKLYHNDTIEFLGNRYKMIEVTQNFKGADRSIVIRGDSIYLDLEVKKCQYMQD